MVLDEAGVRTERYWRLDFSAKRRFASPAERNEEIRSQIRRAVRRRMVADVPLGAFLSGGVDSSTVVAAMAEQSAEPVRTFWIGFTNDEYDELPQARLVAERFATEHHEHVVEPDAVEILPRIVRHYGEPFADPSAIPSFYLAEMARQQVTVALNGDGGDETFGGIQPLRRERAAGPGRPHGRSPRAGCFSGRCAATGQRPDREPGQPLAPNPVGASAWTRPTGMPPT